MSNDYEVGYGKPPKHTQFKKDQSGNPKGRPKGRKNIRTIVKDVLDRTVTITENGRTRRIKFVEAFVRQFAVKALSGSTRDQMMLLKMINDYAPELLKEAELPQLITVKYVSPDGKTMDSYSDIHLSYDTLDNDPKASPAQEQPDPLGDEDDSYLD
ncbi:MAG: hypothetical protein IIA72_21850 [Proteobacteria bacterium]|nr:hypothetical protein [Pseudomonadota bacterium]